MGFLFDSLKNLVGDIECAMLTLDCDIQEKACDRYTGAKKSVYAPAPAENSADTTTPNSMVDDTIAEIVFNTCCKILADMNISANSAGVIANTLAWMLKNQADYTKLSVNDVVAYNKVVPQPADNIVAALTDLTTTVNMDTVLTKLEGELKANPTIMQAVGPDPATAELVRPLNFGQFVQDNQGTMPQLV